jgi:RHS repeat-associated protein
MREWDAETGLYYYRARYYDPTSGAFISGDPMGLTASSNFYGYVDGNPVRYSDPYGLEVYPADGWGSDPRHRAPSGPASVNVCCRWPDIVWWAKALAMAAGKKHCFIQTTHMSGGMGAANAGPLPTCPFGTPTAVVSHGGQATQPGTQCRPQPDVDEKCVEYVLRPIGRPTGPWGINNNCNTFVWDIIDRCKKKGPC